MPLDENQWVLTLSLSFWNVGTVSAASLSDGTSPECAFELTGTIDEGDEDQLAARGLEAIYEPVTICLTGTGGDAQAGAALFDALWRMNLSTKLRAGAICTDACALGFMGGSDVVGTQVTRQIARGLEPGATLVLPALDTSVDVARFRSASFAGTAGIPRAVLRQLRNGSPFAIDQVGDAVVAGVDVLLPPQVPIRSDQQLRNVCDNVQLTIAQQDPESLFVPDLKDYAAWTEPTGLIDEPYFLGTSATAAGDQSDLFVVASYPSGSAEGQVVCVIEFDRSPEESTYGDPAFSAHKASGIRVLLVEGTAPITELEKLNRNADGAAPDINYFDVPRWFAHAPDTLLADLAK